MMTITLKLCEKWTNESGWHNKLRHTSENVRDLWNQRGDV